MNALAIIGIVLAGVFGYCLAAVYVYMRLLWYLKEARAYDPEIPAFLWSFLLPVGVCLLAVYSSRMADRNGIAPRAVRRERRIKDQEEEIRRLERELEITQ